MDINAGIEAFRRYARRHPDGWQYDAKKRAFACVRFLPAFACFLTAAVREDGFLFDLCCPMPVPFERQMSAHFRLTAYVEAVNCPLTACHLSLSGTQVHALYLLPCGDALPDCAALEAAERTVLRALDAHGISLLMCCCPQIPLERALEQHAARHLYTDSMLRRLRKRASTLTQAELDAIAWDEMAFPDAY